MEGGSYQSPGFRPSCTIRITPSSRYKIANLITACLQVFTLLFRDTCCTNKKKGKNGEETEKKV